jgi:hypothetical protein
VVDNNKDVNYFEYIYENMGIAAWTSLLFAIVVIIFGIVLQEI